MLFAPFPYAFSQKCPVFFGERSHVFSEEVVSFSPKTVVFLRRNTLDPQTNVKPTLPKALLFKLINTATPLKKRFDFEEFPTSL